MTEKKVLLDKIAAAKRYVGAAETELDQLMSELRAESRAEKTTVGEVMQSVFAKLRAAKSDVSELEKLLSGMDE